MLLELTRALYEACTDFMYLQHKVCATGSGMHLLCKSQSA